jgi:glutathione S-transferase
MITVHHLNNSRSQRVLWLLEELGLPYEIKHYQRDAKTNLAPPELLQVHPLGKSPVIGDDGRVVAESGTIIDYILRRYGHGRLRPAPSDANYDDYVHRMHYACCPHMHSLWKSRIRRRSIRPALRVAHGRGGPRTQAIVGTKTL